MPAYNSEEWIEQTIRSVLSQTYEDWELLVIDDKSEDSTSYIVRRLAASDKRIRLLSRDVNGGPSRSRNIGLNEARGEFISFIDSDDLIPPYSLEYMRGIMTDYDADIAIGKISHYKEGKHPKSISLPRTGNKNGIVELTDPVKAVEESLYQTGRVEASVYGKIYKRSLFEGLNFREGILYEDLDLFYRIVLRGKRIAVSPIPVYYYKKRGTSLIHSFSRRRLDVLGVTERIKETMKKSYPELLPAALDRQFAANYNVLQLLLKELKMEKRNGGDKHMRRGEEIKESECEETEFYKEKIKETYSFVCENARRELSNKNIRRKNRVGALMALILPRPLLFSLLRRL